MSATRFLHSGALSWVAVLTIWTVNPSAFGQGNVPGVNESNRTLIHAGTTWRYLDQGVDAGTAWRGLDFDDSSWAVGAAQLGYGDGDEVTVIGFGPDAASKYITTYFRHTFDLSDAAQVTRLVLRLVRDDGAVVYLNGQEVARANLPAGPVSFQTLAVNAAGADENQFHDFILGPSFLVNGRNVVAVEVHQVNPASSDLSFDLELNATLSSGEALPVVSLELVDKEAAETLITQNNIDWAEFRVSRTGDTSRELLVFLNAQQGTARLGEDYVLEPAHNGSTVRVLAGQSSVNVRLYPIDDVIYEGDESVFLQLTTPPFGSPLPDPYVIDVQHSAVALVIHDNDAILPVVSLFVNGPGQTAEPCPVCLVPSAAFTVSRTGSTNHALSVTVEYDGPASPGEDYRDLPPVVTIPAGQRSVNLFVLAYDDRLVEGPEIVRASLGPPPEPATGGYVVSAYARQGLVVILDNEPDAPQLRLDLADPEEGAQFAAGLSIEVSALGVWTLGEIDRPVEFFAGDRFIGRSDPPQFGRPTIPGLPSVHTIFWTNPPSGPQVLTARYTPNAELAVTSPPVRITVGPTLGARVGIFADDAEATELPPNVGALDAARFRVVRSGDVSRDLLVFFSVRGSAIAGDYQPLLSPVRIPAGEQSTALDVLPLDDDLREDLETVYVQLEPSPLLGPLPTYDIDPLNHDAVAVIHDDESDPGPALEVVSPGDGDNFTLPTRIELVAAAYHPSQDILRVEFYASGVKIGESHVVFDKTTSGGLIVHRFVWTDPLPGLHLLSARGFNENNEPVVSSQSLRVTVGPTPPQPLVRIEATEPIAEESSFPLRRLALRGVLTISRTGPTNEPLPVFVHYSGTAIPGVDYPHRPWLVSIPAGATSTQIEIVPIDDGVAEGIETLVATLSHCPPDTDPALGIPCYLGFEIDPAHDRATVFVRDDGITQASLAITNPKNGARFDVGAPILIEATAIDLEGYLSRVEFWDGEKLIGVSEIVFIRAPDPGTPIDHSFEWLDAGPGAHQLTARVPSPDGTVLTSPPVSISVGPGSDRVVLEIEATDPLATEPTEPAANNISDPAVFTIRRVAGPQDVDVTVFYSVGGTAQNGIDYQTLRGQILLPGGAASVRLVVAPLPDKALEGDETVVVRLEPPICILIFPPPPDCYDLGPHREAHAVIRDSQSGQPPHVAITKPANDAEFPHDADIEIVAEARDPDGYVRRVEFFADGRKIGEANVEFIRPPDPGQLQTFTFVWHEITPGRHALTARATDDDGATSTSAQVSIRVGTAEPLPIVNVGTRDAFAVEPQSNTQLDTATFRIRRFGPTNDALVVAYSLLGTAENGTDYDFLPGLAIIPAGHRSVTLTVRPRGDDLREGIETVLLRLEQPPPPSPEIRVINPYRVGRHSMAVAVISDEPWVHAPDAAQCANLPGNLVHVCFGAEAGHNFRIEASPDLHNWETLIDTLSDGAWHFIDNDAGTHPRRFYRLTPEPVTETIE